MPDRLPAYLSALARVLAETEAGDAAGVPVAASAAIGRAMAMVGAVREEQTKVMFIGNGGSAGIASHMAIDFLKNGNIPALAFNDGAALTCLGNDLGYEQVFARQIEAHGRRGDLLIAISSSGRSPNILKAVEAARGRGCRVITLSGFLPDNPLRRTGDLNFYLPSDQYGFVEIGHQALIHAILDLSAGWRGRISAAAESRIG